MDKWTIAGIVGAVLVIMNVISFTLMAYDKKASRHHHARRVPERVLFLAAGLFGGLGGVLGMKLLRHKTRHWYFEAFFPAMLALQVVILAAAAYWLLGR